jgi:hypothetical protein
MKKKGPVLHSRVPAPYSRNPHHFEFGEELEMANVQVFGVPGREMPGLKGALATFRKSEQERGDALLNIAGVGTVDGQMADVEDPRPPYVYQPWPKLMYHADGREQQVDNQAEAEEAGAKGFRHMPYPKPQVAIEDPRVEKARLIQDAADARALNAQLLERLTQVTERLAALEATKDKTTAPKTR